VKVQIRLCAQEITLALETAGLAIQKLNASSREIAGTVQTSAGIGKKLHVEVDQSAEILHLIRQLGNRTNVLGLNASIEAANAGALGRGFGVVAKEIKALADETGHSVGRIFKMLENIRGSAEQVLGNVELTREFTEAQAKSTNDLAAMMEGVKAIGRRLMALQS
jgi:methyl-accepting chemotaxis protein